MDAVDVYEIRPTGNFDRDIYTTLLELLKQTADATVDRVSIAGRIIG